MSEQITTHKIDRTGWPSGPWDNEPDRLDFIHVGFSCMMLRTPDGHWCGYVGVPEEHPTFMKDLSSYDDTTQIDLSVHGGVTYTSLCAGVICHVPAVGMPDKVWWIGFDCAHSEDWSPGGYCLSFGHPSYKTMEYVKAEVISLAEQLREIGSKECQIK